MDTPTPRASQESQGSGSQQIQPSLLTDESIEPGFTSQTETATKNSNSGTKTPLIF